MNVDIMFDVMDNTCQAGFKSIDFHAVRELMESRVVPGMEGQTHLKV